MAARWASNRRASATMPGRKMSRGEAIGVFCIGMDRCRNEKEGPMGAPVVHFEIGVRDTAKAKKFYGSLLGWEFQDHGPAAMVAGTPPGIGGHINSLGHE